MNNDANKSLGTKVITLILALALALVVSLVQGGQDGSLQQSGVVASTQQTANQSQGGSGATSSDLVLYKAQTDVDPDDLTIYGEPVGVPRTVSVQRNKTYTSRDEVALYIHQYGRVPSNFVTKTRAREAGWVASEGNLQDVLPGMSIGGGGWHNDEFTMPGSFNAQWRECDINYNGGFRGPERLVYSDEGLIFYTPDHYVSYARLF